MKKTIKRLCAGTIMLCVLFGMAFALPIRAAATSTVSVITAISEAGSTVDVVISLDKNPGLWAIGLKVRYDSSMLTLKSYTAGGIFTSDEITPPQSLSNQPFILSASKTAISNTTATGNLVTLTFSVAANAAYKDYPITLEVERGNTINVNSQMVDLSTANGKVTVVKCLHKDTVWKTVTAATCEQGGTENQVCTKCNEVLNTRDTPALGHNFTKKIISESTKRSDATTTENATYYYTCERCGTISDSLYFTYGDVVTYKFIQGANSIWQIDETTDLTFIVDGIFEKFTGIKVNDVLVDSINYNVKSGSTIVTLKADYLKTLNPGKHSITFVYIDGEISSEFEITGGTEISDSSSDSSSEITESSDASTDPLNKSKNNYVIFIVFAVLLIVCSGVAFVYYKKTRR